MKFTLDTIWKTVTLHDQVSFDEIEEIKKMIGLGWREWKVYAGWLTCYYPLYSYPVLPIVPYQPPTFPVWTGTGVSVETTTTSLTVSNEGILVAN